MIMMIRASLMRECSVERNAFIHVSITVPQSIPHHFTAAVPIKRIAIVEQRDAVHEIADSAKSGERFRRWHRGRARDAVEHVLVRGIIWEELRLRGVQIPRSHHVTRESAAADVNPTC